MTIPPSSFREVFERELARLGLELHDLPGLALESGAEANFLARLRSLAPGATWHDVLPDLPASFVPGQFDTWITPYVPLGPYDYPTAPGSPVVHVSWPDRAAPGSLEALITAARAAGYRIYGGGFLVADEDALLVLARGVSDEHLWDFVAWLEAQPGIRFAAVPRDGTEQYSD